MNLEHKLSELGFSFDSIKKFAKMKYQYFNIFIGFEADEITSIHCIYSGDISLKYNSRNITKFNNLLEKVGIECGIDHILNRKIFPNLKNLMEILPEFDIS